MNEINLSVFLVITKFASKESDMLVYFVSATTK